MGEGMEGKASALLFSFLGRWIRRSPQHLASVQLHLCPSVMYVLPPHIPTSGLCLCYCRGWGGAHLCSHILSNLKARHAPVQIRLCHTATLLPDD